MPGTGLCKGTPTAIAWVSSKLTLQPDGGLKSVGTGWDQLAESPTEAIPADGDFCFSFQLLQASTNNDIMAGVRFQPWTGAYFDRGIYISESCNLYYQRDVSKVCTSAFSVQSGTCMLVEIQRKGGQLVVAVDGTTELSEAAPDPLVPTVLIYNPSAEYVRSALSWK